MHIARYSATGSLRKRTIKDSRFFLAIAISMMKRCSIGERFYRICLAFDEDERKQDRLNVLHYALEVPDFQDFVHSKLGPGDLPQTGIVP